MTPIQRSCHWSAEPDIYPTISRNQTTMTPIQTSAAEYALTLTTQLRHELARLLTLPPPQSDYAANAMRGAEMTADALLRLLPVGKVVEVNDDGTVTIESSYAEYARVFGLSPIARPLDSKEYIPDAETLLP